ncbi:prepilin-type N-terminal cleavage/methylation domain-containing protein [Clostridium perfringens]|uniref:prepilin-type N-terminal cleavage/methylation domain-containing protein n=1 Tax=Clostridium perfringens TaxID=1502 RepID=UPI001C854B45|nr:prepilin-type N-terminal cleavage/methylation domain-containing protein [Clostridium perfringens]MDK0550072.1 prepilin-type N-terminal cleavage/methylation domain-containing protein [Clostridium perfringens]MDK0552897.1 prepilin-type N-terminal cleavage/methylation domain-containing protein [Clostridium perfringens]MDK0834386.1 prepilin-type N-terminal cleavage/methylation domain-containing protein [Clostridium perfringens]MDK0936318.1 prepilin-type N-terminal cleavage/methylation domain-con
MDLKRNNKKKKGFTLIELIIVIAIIAILAAIAIPNFLSIQRKAKVKADIASAKTIYDAASALVAEGKITSNTSYIIDSEADNDVEKYLQTVPVPQSKNNDVFAIIVDPNGKDAVIGEKGKVEQPSQPAKIEVYLVPKGTTKENINSESNKILVYPATSADSAYKLN